MNDISNYEIIKLFKNEYIIKINQYIRLGIDISKSNALTSILKNHSLSKVKEWIYVLKYSIATLLNLVYIIFSSKQKTDTNIFLYTDMRQTRKNYEKAQLVRIGLYNFRNLDNLHILNVLSNTDIIKTCVSSIGDYNKFKKAIDQYAIDILEDKVIFKSIVNFTYLKYLDVLLTIKALEKNKKLRISFSGHFDAYVALLSFLRKRGSIRYLSGHQHGLYELPRIDLEYEKFYVDDYVLMFKESKRYFLEYLNENSNCLVKIQEEKSLHDLITFNKEEKELVVFAMQTDNFDLDKEILSQLINKYNSEENILVCYLHPATKDIEVKKFINEYQNVVFETTQRYENVDVLFTRYSTIGLEYSKINTKVYYILYGDDICISKSEVNNITFIESL